MVCHCRRDAPRKGCRSDGREAGLTWDTRACGYPASGSVCSCTSVRGGWWPWRGAPETPHLSVCLPSPRHDTLFPARTSVLSVDPAWNAPLSSLGHLSSMSCPDLGLGICLSHQPLCPPSAQGPVPGAVTSGQEPRGFEPPAFISERVSGVGSYSVPAKEPLSCAEVNELPDVLLCPSLCPIVTP